MLTFHLSLSNLLNRSMSLIQHVNQPTHEKGHTLDLIMTRSSDDIILSEPAIVHLFLDHFSISCNLSLSKPPLSSKEVTYRPKVVNLPLFLADLTSSNLCVDLDHIENLLVSYNTTLSSLYDHHAAPRIVELELSSPVLVFFGLPPALNKQIGREGKLSQSGVDLTTLMIWQI